jgi:4-hydroxyphenylacetate decarboxylase small subunit
MMEKCHKDCRYYLAVDVFKGLCKRDKANVNADDQACEHFDQVAQCRYCMHYKPQDENLGTCMDKAVAFPEMIAITCEDFKWVALN